MGLLKADDGRERRTLGSGRMVDCGPVGCGLAWDGYSRGNRDRFSYGKGVARSDDKVGATAETVVSSLWTA